MQRAQLSVPIELSDDGSLPSAVRILKFGVNASEKGDYVLTQGSAQQIVDNFHKRAGSNARFGMLDLEHLSLDQSNPNYDPNPRAWWDVELRDDGIYLTNLHWLEDGARRVKEKLQRFLSPVVLYDDKGIVRKLINVALTAQPALHDTTALVAASAASAAGDTPMAEDNSQDLAATIAGALKSLGIDPKVQQALAKSLGIELTGDTEKDIAAIKTAMDEYSGKVGKVLQLVKEIKGGAETPSDAPSESPPSDSPPADAQMASVAASIVASTGVAAGDLAGQVEIWRQSFLSMQADKEAVEKQKKELEAKERHGLIVALLGMNAETIQTAWEPGQEGKVPQEHLLVPIEKLRKRVAALSAIHRSPSPPSAPSSPTHGLTNEELAKCKAKGVDPEKYAGTRARMNARKGG